MERKSKISVTHYLNKKVKPLPKNKAEFYNESKDKEYLPEYPIYYYITIKRKTIHKPSVIHTYLPDNLFEKNIQVSQGFLQDLIKAERNIITKIADIFLTDYEAGRVEKRYRYLFGRGFNAKDEFINGLNSYIAFYTQCLYSLASGYSRKEIKDFMLNRMLKDIDTSMLDDSNRLRITYNDDNVFDWGKKLEFYKGNLNDDNLNGYFLECLLRECLAVTSLKYGYDLPLIEWIKGDLKNDILGEAEKSRERLGQIWGNFGFNKAYFDKHFEPIINKIITVEYQDKYKHLFD